MKNIEAMLLCFMCVGTYQAESADVIAQMRLADALRNDLVHYKRCYDSTKLYFKPFPIAQWPDFMDPTPRFQDSFVLSIPNGRVFGKSGMILVEERVLTETNMTPKRLNARKLQLYEHGIDTYKKIAGRVAVITTSCKSDGICFCHWMTRILGRLALLDLQHIEYDWLYVPAHAKFMKESLQALGVDLNKVIEPCDDMIYIQADELIVPSMVTSIISAEHPMASYCPEWLLNYLRDRLIPIAQQTTTLQHYPEKIFISRKDAGARQIINEDEVFHLFEQKGFEQCIVSDLSFLQQILLFHNAKVIVGAHGAGLINILFAQPGARVIEIFQARGFATYWYLSQMVGLEHTNVKTMEFQRSGSFMTTQIPLDIIQSVVDQL